jgi:DNA-binding response OmpR family regulator
MTKAMLKPPRPRRRLFLFHWNLEECRAKAAALRALGWRVDTEHEDGARGGKKVLARPPDAVLIDLSRLPSHGRQTAAGIRGMKAGRRVPIIFIGGDAEKVAKVRAAVPDGVFTSLAELPAVLRTLRN